MLEDVGNFLICGDEKVKVVHFVFFERCAYESFCLGDVSVYPEFESGLHVYGDAVAVSYV